MKTSDQLIAYVGTYTNGDSKGIYRFQVDPVSGQVDHVKAVAEIGGPTYLTISQNNDYLYSVAKVGEDGGVAAYSINEEHDLTLINHQVEAGSPPCHVSLDGSSQYLFTANYHKGTADVFSINENGQLSKTLSTVQHEGNGPNEARQEKAHAHFAGITPDGNFLCVVDLGTDKIAMYKVEEGKLSLHKEITVKPGSGPRHIRFHPNGKTAYVNAELSSEVIVFEYDHDNGHLKEIQVLSTLPENFEEENTGGALHLSDDGRFLYASNRGHDSIALFTIDENTGQITLNSFTSTEGSHPRDFSIDPTGQFIFAANKDSNNIVQFSRNQETGELTKTGIELSIPNPVCVKFLHVN